jgi:hypothetical protein
MQKKLIIFLIIIIFLSACTLTQATSTIPATASPLPTATATSTSRPTALWISDAVPDTLREIAEESGIPLVRDADDATLHFDLGGVGNTSTWIYALVAPFPTVEDGVSTEELQSLWLENGDRKLWMAESTKAALTALWGQPSSKQVRVLPSDKLLDTLWGKKDAWAIIPFEEIQPRWKVMTIDGTSPLHNNFVEENYPLNLSFGVDALSALTLPATNRDPEKLSVVVLTGVTALVRATAYTMERKGITYPAEDIGDWLRDADITHISNEIPFMPTCKPPTPGQIGLQFCSNPDYIELLEFVGTDVVELTGNHFQDYGSDATRFTLNLYDEVGLPYYGGGRDLADASKALTMEHNGNKFAFIGCNPVGPEFAWARDDGWPGAAPCNHKFMVSEIEKLRADGYLPIATFQYHEYYSPEIRPWQERDFRRLADAGAVVVSGSQAHFAQAKEFYGDAFIDYGLGNLFFDQMDNPVVGTRREFIDRHVFYDGQYLGVELLTAMLVDYSKPIPMTEAERSDFLSYIFEASGWIDYPATPTPEPTMTLTPIVMPQPFYTLTPLPYYGGQH